MNKIEKRMREIEEEYVVWFISIFPMITMNDTDD